MFNNVQLPSEFLLLWMKNNLLPEKEQQVFNTYYKGYIDLFPKRMQYFYDKQLEDALKILSKIENPKVLEIGCGLGTESLFMSLKGADVLGIDIKDDRINTATKRKEIIEDSINKKLNCDFKNISVLELNEDTKYDLIWIEQAYHHLEPREDVSNKISKLLKDDGYLIISEANAWNALLQILLFKRRGFNTINYYEDSKGKKHIYGDERILTSSSLSKIFYKYNINKVNIKYFRLFPNKVFFNKFFKIEKEFPKFLYMFFTHYNYIGRKSKQ